MRLLPGINGKSVDICTHPFQGYGLGQGLMTMVQITWTCPFCQKNEIVEAKGLQDAREFIDTLVFMHEWQACG